MNRIKLSNGGYTIVDPDDFIFLNQWKWRNDNGYAKRRQRIKDLEHPITIHMHRVINCTNSELQVDHINRNKLDNRKSNLRSVTQSQNDFNKPLAIHNTSGYKGVHWHKNKRRWIARIGNKWLGTFSSKTEAIHARRSAEFVYILPIKPDRY